jgi:outer membrane protein TolC
LVVGAGYSGDQLSVPVLQQGGAIDGPNSLPLPSLDQSSYAAGSFYNWGAALLLRQPLWDGGQASAGAAVAEREADLLHADEELARRRIRQEVGRAWSEMQAAPNAIAAGREAVAAGERSVRDARLRYRAMVDPITEVLLVQRDLQGARAALLTTLSRQALERAVLERETGSRP